MAKRYVIAHSGEVRVVLPIRISAEMYAGLLDKYGSNTNGLRYTLFNQLLRKHIHNFKYNPDYYRFHIMNNIDLGKYDKMTTVSINEKYMDDFTDMCYELDTNKSALFRLFATLEINEHKHAVQENQKILSKIDLNKLKIINDMLSKAL